MYKSFKHTCRLIIPIQVTFVHTIDSIADNFLPNDVIVLFIPILQCHNQEIFGCLHSDVNKISRSIDMIFLVTKLRGCNERNVEYNCVIKFEKI